jgi:hypothetical protein
LAGQKKLAAQANLRARLGYVRNVKISQSAASPSCTVVVRGGVIESVGPAGTAVPADGADEERREPESSR